MQLEKDVDLILLDMDGTLLDLHYDTHFWLEFVPEQYALVYKQDKQQAKTYLYQEYTKAYGTLPFYCYDHWSTALGLDIHHLQHYHKDKIKWREDSVWFLKALKKSNKKIVILTNAHPSGIQLKNQQTDLLSYVDLVISSHEIGQAKESQLFWDAVKTRLNSDLSRSIFIDDSETILLSAQAAGVDYVVGINKPNSEKPAQLMQSFPTICEFKELFVDNFLI